MEETNEPTRIAKCDHITKEKDITTIKHAKIVHKIYTKMSVFIKTTHDFLTHDNFQIVLVQVMRELRKASGLYGFEKRQIAIEIMSLLLMELGMPSVVAHYTSEIIERQIETLYTMAMHKYKRKHKHCIIF
jgi:hypothetical protein